MLSYSVASTATGLGQSNVLNHELVPFRRRARYLRLVKKKSHAADYAAGGFHVSVTRGIAGGCADSSANFAGGGTKSGACRAPLDRDDLRSLWANAAQAYLDVANSVQLPLDQLKQMLRVANGMADKAYATEGVEPPRDPVTGDPEPPHPRGVSGIGLAVGLAGLMGMMAYAIHRGQVAYTEGVEI